MALRKNKPEASAVAVDSVRPTFTAAPAPTPATSKGLKPWYKKWWIWVLAVFAIGAIGSILNPPAKVTVPDLVGKSASSAEQELKALNLTVSTDPYLSSSEMEKYEVVSTDPTAGEEVREKSKVKLLLKEIELGAAADQTGKLLNVARSSLELEGYTVTAESNNGDAVIDEGAWTVESQEQNGNTVLLVVGKPESAPAEPVKTDVNELFDRDIFNARFDQICKAMEDQWTTTGASVDCMAEDTFRTVHAQTPEIYPYEYRAININFPDFTKTFQLNVVPDPSTIDWFVQNESCAAMFGEEWVCSQGTVEPDIQYVLAAMDGSDQATVDTWATELNATLSALDPTQASQAVDNGTPTSSEVMTTGGLTRTTALIACNSYADQAFIYGGKYRYLVGVLAEEYRADLDAWFFKVKVEVNNESGATMKGDSECYVTGTEEAPLVISFEVY